MNLNKKLLLIESDRFDPYFNQALEEYLLENVRDNEIILYLWQNENTVFIGRNQDAYNECNIELLQDNNGYLARRTSGGGAVYHDLGNLNFTFVCKDDLYDLNRQNKIILEAVKKLGISADKNGRNDLETASRKFSGHAYYHIKNARYHHGTLMIDVDKDKLKKYLNASIYKLDSHAVSSVKSRVINLKELNEEIDVDSVKDALINSFKEIYESDIERINIDDIDAKKLEEIRNRFIDERWRLGERKEYQYNLIKKYPDALIRVSYDLEDEYIKDIAIFTDSLNIVDTKDIYKKYKNKKIAELIATSEFEERIIAMLKGEEDEI